jgi:hypothetical protein
MHVLTRTAAPLIVDHMRTQYELRRSKVWRAFTVAETLSVTRLLAGPDTRAAHNSAADALRHLHDGYLGDSATHSPRGRVHSLDWRHRPHGMPVLFVTAYVGRDDQDAPLPFPLHTPTPPTHAPHTHIPRAIAESQATESRDSTPADSISGDSKSGHGTHAVVFVHGLGGTRHDLRQLRNYVLLAQVQYMTV